MKTYLAYHLKISSDLPLPELTQTEGEPDIYIRIRPLESVDSSIPYRSQLFYGETEYGKLVVRDGCELTFDPLPGLDEALLRTVILGPALAILLRQRGLFALHASCVAIQGEGVAFVGNSGWGKSTIAKALHGRGYPLVTDDLLVIDLKDDDAVILPSFPQIKLWPDTVVALGSDPSQLSPLHGETEKLAHSLNQGFQEEIVRLRCIYILGRGESVGIHKVETQDALMNLVAHSWATQNLTDRHYLKTHLEQCARLVNRVPLFQLQRPKDLNLLPQIIEVIEGDLAEQLAEQLAAQEAWGPTAKPTLEEPIGS